MTKIGYPDWPSIFGNIQNTTTPIPGTSSEMLGLEKWVIRDMYVSLPDVYQKLRNQRAKPPCMLLIYADVVHIPEYYSWELDGVALVIAARRVEVAGSAQVMLDYRNTKTAVFIVYTNEVVGDLQATAVTSSNPQDVPTSFSVGPLTSIGMEIAYTNGAPGKKSLGSLQGPMLDPDSEFKLSLVSIFQFATVLFESQPAIASGMAKWIKNCTAQSPELAMFLQSSSLLAMLEASSGGGVFVPSLSRSLYTELTKAFVDAASAFEAQYERFQEKNEAIEARKEAAGLMLGHYKDTAEFTDQLIEQTRQNLENALNAVTAADNRLNEQNFKVTIAKTTFEYGIKDWEYNEKLKAAFDIITAVFTFAATISAMCVGDEAAAPAAAGAAGKTARSIGGTAGTAGKVAGAGKIGRLEGGSAGKLAQTVTPSFSDKLARFSTAADKKGTEFAAKAMGKATAAAGKAAAVSSKLGNAMGGIAKATEAIRRILNLAVAISQVSTQLTEAKSMKGSEDQIKQIQEAETSLSVVDPESLKAKWTTFKLEADSNLETAINYGIHGARDYRLQLDILVVYAQSLTTAQLSAARISQEFVRLSLHKLVSDKEVARLTGYINKLNESELPNDAMMQLFYQRYLNVKRSLFVAIENYTWAYRYWALRNSEIRPSIVKPVTDLRNDLAGIEKDYELALQAFNPPPQSFSGKTFVINEASALDSLRKKGVVSWPIQLDCPTFHGFDRVRVTTVRAWLEGAKPKGSTPITVLISNSGNYLDRFKGQTYQFTAAPLTRGFQYRGDEVLVDGKVADEEKYAYFVPTAFSDWKISVPAEENDGIDLSAVTGIRMEFSGSLIAEIP